MFNDGLHHEHSRLEDEYFYKKDRELIEKIKEKERQKQELLERTAAYHKCAKCGHTMEEKVFEDLAVLACDNCDSVHVSLSTLEKVHSPNKWKVFYQELTDAMRASKEHKKGA